MCHGARLGQTVVQNPFRFLRPTWKFNAEEKCLEHQDNPYFAEIVRYEACGGSVCTEAITEIPKNAETRCDEPAYVNTRAKAMTSRSIATMNVMIRHVVAAVL